MPPRKPTKRFRVHFDIQHEQLGSIIMWLEEAGIHNIGYDVITDVPRWTKNKPKDESDAPARRQTGMSVTDEIIELLTKAENPVRSKDIIRITGRSRGNISSVLTLLVKQRRISRVGFGRYTIPSKAAPQAERKAKSNGAEKHGGTIRTKIIAALEAGPLPSRTVIDQLQQQGINRHSVRTAILWLVNQRKLKKLSNGTLALRSGVHVPEPEPAAADITTENSGG